MMGNKIYLTLLDVMKKNPHMILSTSDLCSLLEVSPGTVKNMEKEGKIERKVKLKGKVYYTASSVLAHQERIIAGKNVREKFIKGSIDDE